MTAAARGELQVERVVLDVPVLSSSCASASTLLFLKVGRLWHLILFCNLHHGLVQSCLVEMLICHMILHLSILQISRDGARAALIPNRAPVYAPEGEVRLDEAL